MPPAPAERYAAAVLAALAPLARFRPRTPARPARRSGRAGRDHAARDGRAGRDWTRWVGWEGWEGPGVAEDIGARLGAGWGVLAVATEDGAALAHARRTAQRLRADVWVRREGGRVGGE